MELPDRCPRETRESMGNEIGAHPGLEDEKTDGH
jgi:hypothetical protein